MSEPLLAWLIVAVGIASWVAAFFFARRAWWYLHVLAGWRHPLTSLRDVAMSTTRRAFRGIIRSTTGTIYRGFLTNTEGVAYYGWIAHRTSNNTLLTRWSDEGAVPSDLEVGGHRVRVEMDGARLVVTPVQRREIPPDAGKYVPPEIRARAYTFNEELLVPDGAEVVVIGQLTHTERIVGPVTLVLLDDAECRSLRRSAIYAATVAALLAFFATLALLGVALAYRAAT